MGLKNVQDVTDPDGTEKSKGDPNGTEELKWDPAGSNEIKWDPGVGIKNWCQYLD